MDNHLEFYNERGEASDKPNSGNFVLLIDSQLHRNLASISSKEATSQYKEVVSKLYKKAERN